MRWRAKGKAELNFSACNKGCNICARAYVCRKNERAWLSGAVVIAETKDKGRHGCAERKAGMADLVALESLGAANYVQEEVDLYISALVGGIASCCEIAQENWLQRRQICPFFGGGSLPRCSYMFLYPPLPDRQNLRGQGSSR
jgi:hypothetical protein